MTFSNTQNDAAINAIKAAVSADKATAKLDNAVATLRDAGITSDDISKDGKHLTDFQHLCAETSLNAKQFATWSDDSLAQGKTINGKRVDTERGKLVKRVNSIVARIRAKLKEPVKKGTRATKSPTEKFFNTLDDYIKRFAAGDASDKFDFDPTIARAAFVDLAKKLK
jgi:hypothetical protein